MSKVTRFEDLRIWMNAHELSIQIYSLTNQAEFSKDWGLKDQIRRAAVSVMSNIAEGFERYSRPEFRHFLSIARGSCAEVRSQIQLARSLEYVNESQCSSVFESCIKLSRGIGSLRSSLENGNGK